MAKKTTEAPKEKPTKALATQGAKPLAAKPKGTPIAGKGFENLEREDLLIPRLVLLQPMSPQVMGELDQPPGTIFLNLSNKNLGKEITFTPILHYRSRIKWVPKDDQKEGEPAMDCSAPDAKTPRDPKYAASCAACPHKEWDNDAEKKKDQQPKCTMYENFVVLVGDSAEPVVLSMERTKAKVAKKFYSMMALKGGDMFDWTYKLGVVKEPNPNKPTEFFFNYTVADTGKKTSDERKQLCDRIWENLSKATITTQEDRPEDLAAAPSEAGAGTGKY